MKTFDTLPSLRHYQIVGLAGLALVLGTIGAWAAFASIHGAVIAPGKTVVESHSGRVQHQYGGIVAEISVQEGELVEAGDPVLVNAVEFAQDADGDDFADLLNP